MTDHRPDEVGEFGVSLIPRVEVTSLFLWSTVWSQLPDLFMVRFGSAHLDLTHSRTSNFYTDGIFLTLPVTRTPESTRAGEVSGCARTSRHRDALSRRFLILLRDTRIPKWDRLLLKGRWSCARGGEDVWEEKCVRKEISRQCVCLCVGVGGAKDHWGRKPYKVNR